MAPIASPAVRDVEPGSERMRRFKTASGPSARMVAVLTPLMDGSAS